MIEPGYAIIVIAMSHPVQGAHLGIIELNSVANVRDIGGIMSADGHPLRSGLYFRGAKLDDIDEGDCRVLFNDLGIKHVIDLRCGWERNIKNLSSYGARPYHIPFFDRDIVGIEYTEPAAGTRVVGRDVACNPLHYYSTIPNPLTSGQIAQCLDLVFGAICASEPVYVHCSGGKDRAGIITLLVLEVLGVPRDAIYEDYLATNISRDRRYDEMFERFLRLADGDEKRAAELVDEHRARSENLDAFYGSIDAQYGSFEAYLSDILGFDLDRRLAVQSQLLH